MSVTAEELVARCQRITTLPQIYQKLDEAINDPFSDLSRISQILSSDTALMARLLKLANSAMYNFPSRIDTVTRAITIIGTKQLRDLALATHVIELFRDVPANVVDMALFWRHSIATGIAARVIGIYRREANVERLYVLGMLHDIGRLILYLELPDAAARTLAVSEKQEIPLYMAERELLGFDHAQLGAVLLKEWKLPISLQEGVGFHHTPEKANRYSEDAATVHVADIIANAFKLGSSGEQAVPSFVEEAWISLGMDVEALPKVIEQLMSQYDAAVDIFLR